MTPVTSLAPSAETTLTTRMRKRKRKAKAKGSQQYTADEVELLLHACDGRTFAGSRQAAMIALIWNTGLRHQEALELTPANVSKLGDCLQGVWRKGGEVWTVAVRQAAWPYMDRWMRMRRKTLGWHREGTHLIFATRQKAPWSQRSSRRGLQRLANAVKLGKRGHYHGLRASFATAMVQRGVPLTALSPALGHHSLRTTEIYVQRNAPLDMVKRIVEA